MTGLVSCRLLYALALLLLPASNGLAQAISELPRAEYYVARELFRLGRTAEATEGFQVALQRAQRLGDQRWIDSIPPLVMLGECYYQQGSLALALEQYDAALILALSHPTWLAAVDANPEQLSDWESSVKGINWFPASRPTRCVAVPESMPLAASARPGLGSQPGGPPAPLGGATRLNASEVLRTMGIALMRRWQVLGPLARNSPLTQPLEALFERQPLPQTPWLASSWRVLRGLTRLASPHAQDGPAVLRSGALIGQRLDYYLSPLTLLVLGQVEASQGNYQAAIVTLQDAALLAAQFEQQATLSEAVESLAACAAASRRLELLAPLQSLANWANHKSARVQIAALTGAAELAVGEGNWGLADQLLKQGAAALRVREIGLPRSLAQLSYVNAQLAFAQQRGSLGRSQLDNALQWMHGTAATGAVVESVFRAQMTLDLLAAGALTSMDAERILIDAVAEPGKAEWELRPLQSLAALTTSRLPAFERLLELAVARRAPDELILQRMDRLQRQRFYEALPWGGRLFAWRSALDGQGQWLPAESRQLVEASLQRNPALATVSARIDALLDQLQRLPLPLDERQLGNEAKRVFGEIEELSANLENQLAFQSLQRNALERLLPQAATAPSLQRLLGESDLLLGLVPTAHHIFGVAMSRDAIRFWQVADVESVDRGLQALLVDIGLVRPSQVPLPSAATAADAPWRQSAAQLYGSLFPGDVQHMLESAERLILSPGERLWYLPYELLPSDGRADGSAWIAAHAVTYVPTLGSLSLALGRAPEVRDTVGLVGSLFASERESNLQHARAVLQAIPRSQGVYLMQKINVPSATWLKLRTDQLWVATTVDSSASGWEAIIMPLGKSRQSLVGTWLETPRRSPARVLLPALQTGLASGQLKSGNEIFLPICSLLFSGTRAACLSRWPAGGRSAATLLQRCLEELQEESPSQALRRAVLAQWPEQFLVSEEPALLPAGKEAASLSSGAHPLLWGGYMMVGDYTAPASPAP